MQTPQPTSDPLHDAIGLPAETPASLTGPPTEQATAGAVADLGAADAPAFPVQIPVARPQAPPITRARPASAQSNGGNLRASSRALGVLVSIFVVLAILAIL
ncbi:hypothetical protein GVY41_03290 [Frigidibacter albus]|uniref:Uncharacterized protein n=1 Tax=Frigidibacter albus TaxID=1465486 RepID=A0A6L8VDA7_9RHOB|nr:hypothetical protein [Frigidibacter albus]MZQ88298.1 hypothetical protein [Frigidibacter albus]NBE30028.1 hypothetical protein [Frigidibacter albus]GGH46267.1 hypothetical protein GCM10011341_06630 [Frigidibacter albus]